VPGRATLIQYQLPTRNIDSKARLPRFDYCSLAVQRRVLQHIPPESGHSAMQNKCPLWANCGHRITQSIISVGALLSSGTCWGPGACD
jgi:hypothetical protein